MELLTNEERDSIIDRTLAAAAEREKSIPGVEQPTDLLLAILCREQIRTNQMVLKILEQI